MTSLAFFDSIIEEANEATNQLVMYARATQKAIHEACRHLCSTSIHSTSGTPKLPSLILLDETRNFFHHPNYFFQWYLHSLALDNVWLLEIKNPFTLFRESNLNLAASYIRYFNETQNTHDWIHVMIKMVSFQCFLDAMNADQGTTRTLEFSCWCDGVDQPDPRFRQHRHFIVVAPKDHFISKVWPKVKEIPGIQTKGAKRILKPFHLMNVLSYLSKQTSRCAFTRKVPRDTPLQKKHFFIFKTLPVGYRKPLATQWSNGIFQSLFLEKFQYETTDDLLVQPLIFENDQWKIRIGDIKNLERNIVMPVEKKYSPTFQATPFYIYLAHGRKLYFQIDPENENLTEQEWLEKQVQGGNVFYDIVDDEKWIPSARHQKQLNFMMTRVEKMKELDKENANLKEEIEMLKKLTNI